LIKTIGSGAGDDVDALAGAFAGGVDDLEAQMGGDVDLNTGGQLELAGAVLHVGQAIHVKLEHLGRVLDTQSVTSTQVLVDPDSYVSALGHGSTVLQTPITTL
jgi:hypothetical protein